MKKALTLSLVIPAYNEEHHIEACLKAVNAQTVKPHEAIVVDNNSTDNTVAIAKRFPGVRVVSEQRQGPGPARDKGFNTATGDIIGRIDADTILEPDWVRKVLAFYADPDHRLTALTGGGYFYNIRFRKFFGWAQSQIAFRFNRLLLGHYILWGSNMALPRRLWLQVKRDVCRRQDIHEDLDLAIHLHRAGVAIAFRSSIQVGVKMRRVRSNRKELWANLMWWPQTLKHHGQWTWIFGWIGAAILYALSPLLLVMELVARIFGRKPLKE